MLVCTRDQGGSRCLHENSLLDEGPTFHPKCWRKEIALIGLVLGARAGLDETGGGDVMLGAHSTKPSIGLLAFRRFARHVSPLAAGACALRAAVGALPGAGEVVGLGHPAGRQRLARGATSDSVGDVGDGVGEMTL